MDDYHVNTAFSMGRGNQQDDGNSESNSMHTQPSTMAPATLRMMGKSSQQQQQQNTPLMPPADIKYANNGNSHQAEQKERQVELEGKSRECTKAKYYQPESSFVFSGHA